MPFLICCLVGAALGFFYRSGRALLPVDHFEGSTLALVLLVVQSIFRSLGPSLGLAREQVAWLWALGAIGLLFIAILNLSKPGLPWLVAGLACNLLVVTLSGGMPLAGIDEVRASAAAIPPLYTDSSEPIARILGDVIPIPSLLGSRYMLSIGDALMLVGTTLFVAAAVRGFLLGRADLGVAHESRAL